MHRTPSPRPIRTALGLLAALVLLASPGAARADGDLNAEMAEIARQIKLLLDQKGKNAIAVGEFRGPARLAASGGPAISKALGDALKSLDVKLKRNADLEVNGDFRDVEDGKTKLLALEIKASIVDRAGNVVVAFEPRGILNVTTIATLIGVTAILPADATDEQRDETLTKAVDHPDVSLANTRIAPGSDSPYAVEILVGADPGKKKPDLSAYRPRAASKDDDGFAFLKIRRGEVYAVELINDSPHDAAVTLTVDGLSVFAFSANTNYTHWIVPSKKTLVVPGWHRSNQLSDTFQVTEYAKSAVAEMLPSSTNVGTITAAFAAAWPQGSPPPKDEAPTKEGTRAGDATGKGPAVETKFEEVVRDVGRLRASVSVRYTKDAEPKDLPGSKP